jgi:hypothetical protein
LTDDFSASDLRAGACHVPASVCQSSFNGPKNREEELKKTAGVLLFHWHSEDESLVFSQSGVFLIVLDGVQGETLFVMGSPGRV